MKLTNDQENALRIFEQFIDDPEEIYMIIQGDSGTGKSTLIKMMMHYIRSTEKMYQLLLQEETAKWQINLTATTNKAVQVLSDMLEIEVRTIHSVLQLKIVNNFKTGEVDLKPGRGYELIRDALIIIDEASFIDDKLFEYINSTTVNCKIILIGDQYQLAPIKQAVPIMQKLQCKYYANLTEIMRNKGPISELGVQFKQAVQTNIFSLIKLAPPTVIHTTGPEFKAWITQIYTHPKYQIHHAKILAWRNDQVLSYNTFIRGIRGYTAQFKAGEYVITNKPIFYKGARYMTDKELLITHIGEPYILHDVSVRPLQLNNEQTNFIFPTDQQAVKCKLRQLAKLKEWPLFFTIKDDWLDLRSVYASTVHKSQGSEYDIVFLDLSDISRCHISTDVARMLYVAATRATKKVVLYGELADKYRG